MIGLNIKTEFEENGYLVINDVYSDKETKAIINCINSAENNNEAFLKTKDLFAIRKLIKNIPELKKLLFNKVLIDLLSTLSASDYFITKAIYFDKPSKSNWFVGYHQDLSISVDQRIMSENYNNWILRKGQHGVQPPLNILESSITIRIHLDDTDENNGALKVIPKSHLKEVIRIDNKKLDVEGEQICQVEKGGVMLMRPLTLHASNRTTNGKQRRVIHLEFCNQKLESPLNWLEHDEVTA
jgi:ectoine hydroxylase-related dioxygenase (phytanoyl-CoA dioxygenase family)